ncbi:MAG: ABC transporter transmembrane domain-containing protein [Pseudomonadales bacterium]
MQTSASQSSPKHPASILWQLISPDISFFKVAITYSIAISLLTLAVPIAVQTMVNTLVNIASLRAIIILSILLLVTLLLSAGLSALRTRTMEYFERRIYARLTAEVSLYTIYARHEYFAGRRNTDITNRYFDIVILQKNIPFLLVDGFALALQVLVGFTLVSVYHPILLLFNVAVVSIAFLFWKLWGGKATASAVELSHSKYEMSKWLDSLAYANEFFKSTRHIDYALGQTDALTERYVKDHQQHFKYTFSQTVGFLLLYAISSAGLLLLGGWLVIIGQLSLGQLIAAELILAAILFGLSKTTDYLKSYYEMCGAADELGQVFDIPQESIEQNDHRGSSGNALIFDDVVVNSNNSEHRFNFSLPENAKILVAAENASIHYTIIHLLKCNIHPLKGSIQLADSDLDDFDVYHLRQDVVVIDRAPIIECTIEDYLRMSKPGASSVEVRSVLDQINILDDIEKLPKALQTMLSPLGDPLSPASFLQLKLAAALLTQPKVLVLTQFFDILTGESLNKSLSAISQLPVTLLFFSSLEHSPFFTHRLILGEKTQTLLDDSHPDTVESTYSNLDQSEMTDVKTL